MKTKDIDKIEMDLFLEAVVRRYGYDFRHYARSSLKRRLAHTLAQTHLNNISEMTSKVIHDENFFNQVLVYFSITVTEMFRDPGFYLAIREKVIPVLRTYPFIKIWHAGCATGEEAYSLAIVLKEEGFLKRTHIYATDFNTHSLGIAGEGIYSLENIKKYTDNYNKSGGRASFSDYYHSKYGSAKIADFLKEGITFSHHNLVTDGVFGEMHLILCRNVLIYFDRTLQDRALSLFRDSLCSRGFLCLGSKETLDFSNVHREFELVSRKEKIYRKLHE